MRIHVHCGAHKTATTFKQSVLNNNRVALNNAGVGYMHLKDVRERFTNRMDQLDPVLRIDDFLGDFFEEDVPPDIKGVILSDENFFGTTRQSIGSGVFHPYATERANRLRTLLRGHEVTVFLCIRSYDDFIASLYGEALRWGNFVPFEDFKRRLDFKSFRWPNFYNRSVGILGPANFKVWRYEDFRMNSERVIRALAFDTEIPLDLEYRDVNPSMSHNAIMHLHELAKTVSPEEVAVQVRDVDRRIPKTPDNGSFNPWSENERGQLRRAYEMDCSTAPDYWLVKPVTRAA